MASKNARLQTIRLMAADLEAVDKIATETGKTRNAVIVSALRKEIQNLTSNNEEVSNG